MELILARARGAKVHPVLGPFFGMGVWSLGAWSLILRIGAFLATIASVVIAAPPG